MNKIRILTLILLVFSSSLIFGQTNKFEAGLEMGPSLISLRGNDYIENHKDLSFGFSSGLAFQYNLTKLLSFRTNLSMERKGLTINDTAPDEYGIGEITLHSNLDYLIVPLLCRITLGKKIMFFLNGGPYLGYLIKQQDKLEAFGENPESKTDNTENFERLDYGLTTGLGVNYPISEKLLLSVEIRNNLGFNNINPAPTNNDGSINTNSTNLLIGITYRIKNRNE